MPYAVHGFSPLSFAVLRPLIVALDATGTAELQPPSSLPRPCYRLASIDTLVCATPVQLSALFRSEMIIRAMKSHVDVALLRHSPDIAALDELSFDIVLRQDRPLTMIWDLHAYRHHDSGYWLVPPKGGAGPSIRVGFDGFTPIAAPPYRSMDERAAGVARAVREAVWEAGRALGAFYTSKLRR